MDAIILFLSETDLDPFASCPVSTCRVVADANADLVITTGQPFKKLRPSQLILFFGAENPTRFKNLNLSVDLTATYRPDSDIVRPIGMFQYFKKRAKLQKKNYALGKSKKVAWFVSNCGKNVKNNRYQVAQELSKFISVDTYGKCGNLTCPRSNQDGCFDLLRTDYKFYLSFENANCSWYITEKFFKNALMNDVIPIVMGGRREEYERLGPPNSFIHVNDFESVESLAKYLKLLDEDDTLYNSYFRWKSSGKLVGDTFECRLCAILHMPQIDMTKLSLHGTTLREWWQGKGVCW